MKSGEGIPENGAIVENDWNILLPENNGIGEFDAVDESENSKNVQTSSTADSEGLEVNPDIIDAHIIRRAWDPGSTELILGSVLDDDWVPDLDDERPETMTIEERFKELRNREQFLDGLESHQLHPNPDDAWKYEGIDKTVSDFRNNYLDYLEKQKQHPEDSSYGIMVKNAHDMLVTVRTYQFLASDPKRRRAEIEYDRAGLSTVLAKRDERYEAAFENIDIDEIEQKVDKLIDKIPSRSFMKLAKLLPPGEPLNQDYIDKAADVALRALGLSKKDAEYLIDDNLGEYTRGECRDLGNGKSRVFINTTLAGDNAAAQGGGTVAHETLHALQHKIEYAKKDTPSGEFYRYCFNYYIPARFDYNKYASQYVEAEAFYFGNEFGKRIEDAQAKLSSSRPHKLLDILKRRNKNG